MTGEEIEKIKARVLEAAGGRAALADALGISPPAVSQWGRIPAERVGQISRVTGMTYAEIRPDLFAEQATA